MTMLGIQLPKPIEQYPCLRRFLNSGFERNPQRDAPKFGMICLETINQTIFINPETGYMRFGRTIATVR